MNEQMDHGHSRKEVSIEMLEQFRAYITAGESLVKEGNYSAAIAHFQKSIELEKIGWKDASGNTRSVFLRDTPATSQECVELAHFIAENSREGKGKIELSKVLFFDTVPQEKRILPSQLQQDIALVYLEEWLHVLQEIQGGFLTERTRLQEEMEKRKLEQPQIEIDIALYMKQNSIPVTQTFLERYERHKIFESES